MPIHKQSRVRVVLRIRPTEHFANEMIELGSDKKVTHIDVFKYEEKIDTHAWFISRRSTFTIRNRMHLITWIIRWRTGRSRLTGFWTMSHKIQFTMRLSMNWQTTVWTASMVTKASWVRLRIDVLDFPIRIQVRFSAMGKRVPEKRSQWLVPPKTTSSGV